MSKEVLLFPGADAIEERSLRIQAMKIPAVVEKINEADQFFQLAGIDLKLSLFMEEENTHLLSWFQRCSIATVAVQIGLYTEYVKMYGEPEVFLSCSLGDTAKNICLGAFTFHAALPVLYQFAMALSQVKGGATFRVTKPTAFSADEIREFKTYQVDVSMHQTPRHILVAGLVSDLKKWMQEYAVHKRYKIKPLYPFPLHTPYMQSSVTSIEKVIHSASFAPWSKKIWSALSCSWISDNHQLKEDMLKNAIQVVRWSECLKILHNEWGYNNFINLGPSSILTNFHEKIFKNRSAKIIDFFSHLVAHQNQESVIE